VPDAQAEIGKPSWRCRLAAALRPHDDINLEVKRLNHLRVAGSLLAVPVLAGIALFTAHPTIAPALWRAAGALLIFAGVGLRLWALACIDGRKKRLLVTWGPYRHFRHPLYCGSLLLVLGFCSFAGSLTATVVACLLFLGIYLPIVRAEERFLARQFGCQWDDYRQMVRALVPSLGPSAPTPLPFRLRRPLRELGVLLLLCLVAFGASELVRHLGRGLPDWFF
jgi:protein-S-isoprenylcysteine O-methyltransferase Ste14